MNYLAQGLNEGFSDSYQATKQSQMRKADALLRQQLADQDDRRQVMRDAAHMDRAEAVAKIQRDAALAEIQDRAQRIDGDPRTILARKEAQDALDKFGQPTALSPDDQLAAEVNRLKLSRERDQLTTPPVAPVPTAKIKRAIGTAGAGGEAEYTVPITDLESTVSRLGAGAYKSPYDSQIADLNERIAKQSAAIGSGDGRTGLLGIGTSRQGLVDAAQKQLIQLQAMRLKHMRNTGVITAEEADAQANQLLGTK